MKHSNLVLAVLAIGLCLTLVFADNLQSAYALSVTNYAVGGTTPNDALRFGNKVYVAEFGSDQVRILTADTATSLGTVALIGVNRLFEYNGRIYAAGTTLLIEIDASLDVQLRSMSHGCTNGSGFSQDVNNDRYLGCYAEVANTIRQVDLNTMTVIFTSTTTNAGATPCDISANDGTAVDFTNDRVFILCSTSARVVGIEGITASGTPDFGFAFTTGRRLAYNPDNSNLLLAGNGGTALTSVTYSPSTGFTSLQVYATFTTMGAPYYNSESNRYAVMDGTTDCLLIIDANDGDTLVCVGMTTNTGSGSGVAKGNFYDSQTIYLGANAGAFYVKVDLTGIPFGGGADEPAGGTGVDCTLPANEFLLICRLGGDGSLVSAGAYIVGNSSDGTGLSGIICSVGIVDCVADPNMKTNGVGYLLVAIALAIIIGILWVASRGDLNSIPTFIWFIATLAVVGAFTLMNLIDATFLVVTVIIVVALAAAKVRGLFGGEFR